MGRLSEINKSEVGVWTVTALAVVGAWFMKYAAVWSSGYFYSMTSDDALKNQIVVLLLGLPAIGSVYICGRRLGWMWALLSAPILFVSSTIITIRFMRAFHGPLIERVKYSNTNIEISDSISAHWAQVFYTSILMAAMFAVVVLVVRALKNKKSTSEVSRIAPVVFLGLMAWPPAEAAHLDDARKFRQQGQLLQSALSATKGCSQPNQQSCSFLCALGIENQNSQWIDLGCDTACTLGDANACSSLGGRKVLSGQTSQGVTLLKRACTLGDVVACSQLKLLKVK